MINIARRGNVRLDGRHAGTLTEDEARARITFAYDEDYVRSAGAVPISLTLPLDGGPWTTTGLHPFFAGLLPEGWLKLLAEMKLHVAEDDAFGLLLATGADCVGAVEVVPGDTPA